MKPTLYMLCGPVCCGKSTFYRKMPPAALVATDYWIEQHAESTGNTYNGVFASFIKEAEVFMAETLKLAISQKMNIVWDQTNLTWKTREKKLRNFEGTDYHKIGVFFRDATKELIMQRNVRPGKIIPEHVIDNMLKTYEESWPESPAQWTRNELGPYCPFDEMWFVSAVTGKIEYVALNPDKADYLSL